MARSVTRTNLDIPSELHDMVVEMARENGISKTALIIRFIVKGLAEEAKVKAEVEVER